MTKILCNRLHSSEILTTFAKNVCFPSYENKFFDRYPTTHLLDTYLSPLTYRDGHATIMDDRLRAQSLPYSKQK